MDVVSGVAAKIDSCVKVVIDNGLLVVAKFRRLRHRGSTNIDVAHVVRSRPDVVGLASR